MNQTSWQKIEEIFNAVLELPSDKRSEFLEVSCAGENELKNEVESLLAKAETEDSFLGKPNLSLGLTLLHQEKNQALLGEKIGRYQIIKLLGEGGMGEVYLAQDTSLNRLVALKLLPTYLVENDESVNRFQKEALAASAVSHPNIAHIYEAGSKNNRRFIAMEYVEGTTLRDLLKAKKLDVVTALEIALQTANALSAAHLAGIIHRDIKPENIMLRPEGFVKVLDFGIAKLSEPTINIKLPRKNPQSAIRNPQSTNAGMVMGTIGYISPEQLQNKQVDARADIWSLGVVLFEMLTGRKPFEGKTTEAIGKAILTKNPMPFSLSIISPKDEHSLKNIIAKTLNKDATKRYESAVELANDLKELKQSLEYTRQFTSGKTPTEKILADGADTNEQLQNSTFRIRTKQFWSNQSLSRKALIMVFLIASLTFSLGIFAKYLNQYFKTYQIKSLAVLPFDNETGDEEIKFLSTGLADDLIRNLGQANVFEVIALYSSQQIKERKLSYAEISKNLQVTTILEGKVRKENGKLLVETRLVDLSDSHIIWQEKLNVPNGDLLKLRNALTILISNRLQGIIGAETQLLFAEYPTANNEAYRLYLKAKFNGRERTSDELRERIKVLEAAVTLDPNYTFALIELAANYNLIGTFLGQSPEYFQLKAKETLEKALKLDNSLSEAHTLLGKIKMDFDHDWAGCEREFKRAIEINPNNELAHHWYGEVFLSAMKRMDESFAELAISRRQNPLHSGIVTAVSWSYIGAGEYQKAIDECNLAQKLNPDDNDVYHYRAQALFKLNRFDEAVKEMDTAITKDPKVSRYYALKSVFLAADGKKEEAQKILNDLQTKPNEYGDVSKYSVAIVENALGNRDQAFELLNQELKTKSVDLLSIKIDPLMDSMRDDARFVELERKLNFSKKN